MNFDKQKQEADDLELEAALKNFRKSVRSWSDTEFGRVRSITPVRAGFWVRMRKPIVAGALGCVVAVTAITIPVNVAHNRQIAALHEAQAREQQRLAGEAAMQAALRAAEVNDDKLMADVDSDIAQEAPDAFEPLASLMNDSKAK
jgi:hypothetical protein